MATTANWPSAARPWLRIEENPEGRPLTDVLKFGEEYLGIRTDVSIVDDDDGEHEFDFKYDEESEKFGAGTAFLQD